MVLKLLVFMFLISSAANAAVCSQDLLLSGHWKHEKSGDIYTLRNGGKMSCFNEGRHRNECDYVYMSDFRGLPRSWELVGDNTIKITFKRGLFRKETIEFSCEYITEDKSLKVGRLYLVMSELPES